MAVGLVLSKAMVRWFTSSDLFFPYSDVFFLCSLIGVNLVVVDGAVVEVEVVAVAVGAVAEAGVAAVEAAGEVAAVAGTQVAAEIGEAAVVAAVALLVAAGGHKEAAVAAAAAADGVLKEVAGVAVAVVGDPKVAVALAAVALAAVAVAGVLKVEVEAVAVAGEDGVVAAAAAAAAVPVVAGVQAAEEVVAVQAAVEVGEHKVAVVAAAVAEVGEAEVAVEVEAVAGEVVGAVLPVLVPVVDGVPLVAAVLLARAGVRRRAPLAEGVAAAGPGVAAVAAPLVAEVAGAAVALLEVVVLAVGDGGLKATPRAPAVGGAVKAETKADSKAAVGVVQEVLLLVVEAQDGIKGKEVAVERVDGLVEGAREVGPGVVLPVAGQPALGAKDTVIMQR